jgi:hypothetical protein
VAGGIPRSRDDAINSSSIQQDLIVSPSPEMRHQAGRHKGRGQGAMVASCFAKMAATSALHFAQISGKL